ncbi:MAG: hypothetical protein AAFZ65_08080 [Planctomycetota bacterium]
MITTIDLETPQAPRVRGIAGSPTDLRVAPEDIQFRTLGGAWEEVSIRVRNHGPRPTAPTTLLLETASFGLFLPNHPVCSLQVPTVEARGSVVLGASLPLLPVSSGSSAPRADRPEPSDLRLRPGLPLIQRVSRQRLGASPRTERALAPDLHALLGHVRSQWAGNVRVQVGGRCTERHAASGLRVRPRVRNVALFMLGRRPGQYTIAASGAASHWAHRLIDMRSGEVLPTDGATPISATGPLCRMLGLVVEPPLRFGRTPLDLRVTHAPSGERQCLEFEFDPGATGAACTLV